MNVGIKIQRCNFLPEGEMAIIKDTNTLIHNIVDSELKEKDKEIERLNNIINELEKWLKEHSKIDYNCREIIIHEQLALNTAYEYLQELKEKENE